MQHQFNKELTKKIRIMKKLLLFVAALFVAAGAMAQDIYTAQTIYNNGDGTLYIQKNGQEIASSSVNGYTYTCTDMITGGDGCVYYTVNCVQNSDNSQRWTDIRKYNPSTSSVSVVYDCPTGQGIKINDLAWYDGHIYGAGYYHGNETNREFGHVVKDGTVIYHFSESDYGTEFNGITIDQLGNIWTVGCENNSMGTSTPDYAYGTVYKNGEYYAQVNTNSYSRFTDVEQFNGRLYLMGEMKVDNHWSGMFYSIATGLSSPNADNFSKITQVDNPNANYNVTFNKMAYDAYNIYMVGCIAGDKEYVWKYNYPKGIFSTLGNLGAPSGSAGIAASSSGIYAAYNGGNPVVGTGGSTFNQIDIQFTSAYKPHKIAVVESVTPNKVYSLPFEENFSYGSTEWNQWMTWDYDDDNANLASYWARYDYNNSTDICASHRYRSSAQSGDLASPMIRIPSDYNVTLSFNSRVPYSQDYPQNEDGCSVYVIVADDEQLSQSNFTNYPQTKVWTMDDHMDLCHDDSWEWIEIDLSAYKGHVISVVFYYNGENAHQWLVDDIEIYGEYDGVKEDGENAAISVMPNPASDVIRVNGLNGTAEVNIYNTLGQVVKSERLSDGQSINISDLSAGVYMLRSENSTQVVKFTVK